MRTPLAIIGLEADQVLTRRRTLEEFEHSPEHLPHLFERFYRVEKSRSRHPETGADPLVDGNGLGQAIVLWIALARNGQVKVQSEVNKGTAFEVTLPGKDMHRIMPGRSGPFFRA